MTRAPSERLSWREGLGRAFRLYFAPFLRVDPMADQEAGPFAQRFQRWALAITAMAGAGIGISQFMSPQPFTMSVVTGMNQWSSRKLPDGSVVHVSPVSNLTVRLDTENRRIDVLRGEMLAEVAHESRPFTVYAGATQTRAVGTQFSVRHEPPGNVKVAVVEGEVRFKSIGANGAVEERPLTAGAGASVSKGQMQTFYAVGIRRVHWEGNTLDISGATVGEVVAQINLRESRQIVIDDPRIAATLLPRTFLTRYSQDGFLDLIEEAQLNIGVRRAGGVVHLAFEGRSVPGK